MSGKKGEETGETSLPKTEFEKLVEAMQFLMNSQYKLTTALKAKGTTGTPIPPASKISIKVPTFKGDPKENAKAWLLQCHTVFEVQGIDDSQTRIRYAATGLEGAALQWYLSKATAFEGSDENPFEGWRDFQASIKAAFMPPNYQHHLRQQLRKLKQTGSVQEYGMNFRNLIGQIDEIAEIDKVTYFIEGLKPATKMEVAYQAPDNFEDAWALAIRFDTAMFSSSRREFSPQVSHRYGSSSSSKSSFTRNHGNNSGSSPM